WVPRVTKGGDRTRANPSGTHLAFSGPAATPVQPPRRLRGWTSHSRPPARRAWITCRRGRAHASPKRLRCDPQDREAPTMNDRARLVLCLSGALLAAGGALAAPTQAYRLHDLGAGYPAGVDARGDVSGAREVAGEFHLHATRWRDGRMETLPDIGFGSKAAA